MTVRMIPPAHVEKVKIRYEIGIHGAKLLSGCSWGVVFLTLAVTVYVVKKQCCFFSSSTFQMFP